jgi:hypothetical protein
MSAPDLGKETATYAELGSRDDVFLVFRGQGRRRQATALAVDALVVGQLAAVADDAMNLPALDALNVHDDAAVIKQQHIAGTDIIDQFRIIEADPTVIAQLASGVEDEWLRCFEENLAAGKLADADFRTLQVGHDANRATDVARRLAQCLHAQAVIVGGTVRKVEAHDIDAGSDELRQNFRSG